MKTPLLTIFLILSAMLCLSQSKISDALLEDIQQARASNMTVEAMIYLADQFDIQALDRQLTQQKVTPHERGVAVVTALMEHSERTQAELISYLESRKGTDVVRYQAFWIDNAIYVEAKAEALMDIAQHRDLAQLDTNEGPELIQPVSMEPASRMPGHAEPGLRAINAHKMWQLGFTGEGVIVGVIDTGIEGTHPAVSGSWHGHSAPAAQAWNDPGYGTTIPTDTDGHGTHVTGILAGLDPSMSDTIGVAFGAEWICGRFAPGNVSAILANLQWIANPDGDPLTTDDMPAVVSNSWGDTPGSCTSGYLNGVQNLEAAGVAVVFAAGNSGPNPSTICAPAKSNFTDLQVFSVGAVDGNNEDLPIAIFSSRGPTTCTQGGNQIKPEVSAPGTSVRSSCLGGSYAYMGGTSMAAPHVGGALALLKQAFPDKTGNELKQMLYETSRDQGEPGEDNTYGMGVIDVYQAYIENAEPGNPRPPNQVSAYSDYTTPTVVSVTWTDPTSLVGGGILEDFEIQVYRDNTLVASIPEGQESFEDNGLTDGRYYEYTVNTLDLSTNSISIARKVNAWTGGSPTPAAPSNLAGSYSIFSGITITWSDPLTQSDGTPLDDLQKIIIYRDGANVGDVLPGTETWTDSGLPGEQTYAYTLVAVDNEIPKNFSAPTDEVNVFNGNKPDILVYHGVPSGQPVLEYADSVYEAIRFFTPSVYKTDNLAKFGMPLDHEAIFLVTGAKAYQTFLTPTDGNRLLSYMNLGGSVYVEGNSCFNLFPDEMGAYNLRPFLGLDQGSWTYEPLDAISGLNDLSGMNYQMPPIDGFWDILNPATSTMTLWEDPDNGNILGVYNEYLNGKIIGVVPPYAEMYMEDHPENKIYLMCRYLEMLGVEVGCYVGEEELAVDSWQLAAGIYPNPVFSRSEIRYQVGGQRPVLRAKPEGSAVGGNVKITVHDITGKQIRILVDEVQAPGEQVVHFDASGLPAGIYLVQLEAGEAITTIKMVVMR